ncbi:hypothetical protein OXYTRIMIC_804 [Oxytricha trifallax]|uniref:Uncharacterized protein n=1 Tax=Oxytricha trifallax TaxID=1172189 RepID=A0A073HX53_9SPIT|nr:hypothetical protein OXYTRIMIC_804 [Oxytricha trifallax]
MSGKIEYMHFVFVRLLKLNKIDEAKQLINTDYDHMVECIKDSVAARLKELTKEYEDREQEAGRLQNIHDKTPMYQRCNELSRYIQKLEGFFSY